LKKPAGGCASCRADAGDWRAVGRRAIVARVPTINRRNLLTEVTAVCLALLPGVGAAAEIAVAAASNFSMALTELAADFEARTEHRLRVSLASTGKLYAQIANGAPYDVLLAADSERPLLLEKSGDGVAGSRFTYAIGALVLWSRDPTLAGRDCRDILSDTEGGRIAIANPETAPYGAAARDFLRRAGLWDAVAGRLAYGENIAQALQFAASGNARAGFIAEAQAIDPRLPAATCRWHVPSDLHEPLEQQALLLRRGAGEPAATEFLGYLESDAARAIILRHGYRLPEH